MDNSSLIVIHVNDAPHQKLYADYLVKGFSRIGRSSVITNDPAIDGDIHVCIGPHFALSQCKGRPTIYIDRCLWDDHRKYVTIGWLKHDGGMIYPENAPDDRPKPELKPWKTKQIEKAIVLLDYGPYPETYLLAQEIYQSVKLRPHPATRTGSPNKLPPLVDELASHDLAIGYRTSALVTAAIEGLPIICLDKRAPAWDIAGHDLAEIKRPDRTQWLNNMSYAQWSDKEIASGEALEYALDNRTIERAGNAG